MPQREPRGKHLVTANVFLHGDVDPDGLAVEGELAEPPVHVPAARAHVENGLLAVVVDDERPLRLALHDPDAIGVVTRDLRRILGIGDQLAPGGRRQQGDDRNRDSRRFPFPAHFDIRRPWKPQGMKARPLATAPESGLPETFACHRQTGFFGFFTS